MLEQAVRRVEPEDDDFTQLLTGSGKLRELDTATAQTLRERALAASIQSTHMSGYLKGLRRFVMGQGPQLVPQVESEDLKVRLDAWWGLFRQVNKWDVLEDEIPFRMWRDGEVFIRRFVQEANSVQRPSPAVARYLERLSVNVADLAPPDIPRGMLLPRLIPVEEIRDPAGTVTHGIITAERDVHTVLGYMWSPDGTFKEAIPADQILHEKIGVDLDVKRGRTILEPLLKRDKQYEDWLNYRIILNLVRTAVVLVKKIEGTPTQIRAVRDAQTKDRATTLNDRRQKMLKPGTTVHAGPGISYEFKNPQINARDAQHDGRSILLDMAAATGLPEYMFTGDACVDEETEILTDAGWLKCSDAERIQRDNLRVGTIHPSGFDLEYQLPTKVFLHERTDSDMWRYSGKTIDMLVTPNHDLWVGSRSDYGWYRIKPKRLARRWVLHQAQCAPSGWQGEPTPMRMNVPGLGEIGAEQWARALGIYLGDGSVTNGDGRRYSRVTVGGIQKSRKRDLYAQVFRPLGFHLHTDQDGRDHWYTDNPALHDWLTGHVGAGAGEKRVPDYVGSWGHDMLRALWVGLQQSDGHQSTYGTQQIYTTTSPGLADDVQLIALKLGLRAHIRQRPPGAKGHLSIYRVETCERPITTLRRDNLKLEHGYTGMAWCVEVPNGLIVVRRHGTVCVTGNSNSNYASTLVAEGPAIREFQDWRDTLEPIFVQVYRWCMEEAAKERQIKGLSPEQARELEVEVEWAPLLARDEFEHAQANELRLNNKIISREGWARDDGIDWEVEQERIEQESEGSKHGRRQPEGRPGAAGAGGDEGERSANAGVAAE